MRNSAGDDRGEPQSRPGGVTQLDPSALSHKRFARHGPVDEHAVTALAAHRPPGRGGSHPEVCTGDEGVDDLHVAVRCAPHGERSGEGMGLQRCLGRKGAHDECGSGQGAILPEGRDGAPATILVFQCRR